MIKVNGKEMSKKEALSAIDSAKRIQRVSLEIPNPNLKPGPITMKGFTIGAAYLISIAKAMDRSNATYAKVVASHCRSLGGKSVIITIRNGEESWLEKSLRRIGWIT